MTRQNCKNCGEPYVFDNLVTPGRATILCHACQRKIYVHTGQIYFDPPVSKSGYVQSSVKIPLGQGVSVIQDPGSDSQNAKQFSQWQSSSRAEKTSKSGKQDNSELEFKKEVDMEFSRGQIFILMALYFFCCLWIVMAFMFLYQLMKGYSFETIELQKLFVSFHFLALVGSLFCSLISLALAEGCKKIWRRL